MKKFVCLLLCLLIIVPAATASDVNPAYKFQNQFITGGSGIRAKMSLTASGTAEWLEYLQPFTASEIQMRLIGQAHGEYSDSNPDDDAWQARLYVEDSAGQPKAVTRLYGDPSGIYLSSELVPDMLLTLPVKNVHLPYELVSGDFAELFMGFDPFGLLNAGGTGNPDIYAALAEISGVDAEAWTPVLEKYDAELEMWLAAYATAPVVSGSTGTMTLRTSYSIPADDVKAEAKKLIGMMMYDQELLALLQPCFTPEQQAIYLNPNLVYFYEFCIDALPLEGRILLESEMTALGEAVETTVSLPVPALPEELAAPIGKALSACFSLPYTDVLAGVDHITFTRAGGDVTLGVTSPARTISFTLSETVSTNDETSLEGFVRIIPTSGSNEAPLYAAINCKSGHKVWSEEDGELHEDILLSVAIAPDLSLLDDDDPFRSRYVDFSPIALDLSMQYMTKDPKAESAVTRLLLDVNLLLHQAQIGLDAELRTANKWEHEKLPTNGAENVLTLPDARREAILDTLLENAVTTMVMLNTSLADVPATTEAPVVTPAPTETPAPAVTEAPAVEPTEVPPVGSNVSGEE